MAQRPNRRDNVGVNRPRPRRQTAPSVPQGRRANVGDPRPKPSSNRTDQAGYKPEVRYPIPGDKTTKPGYRINTGSSAPSTRPSKAPESRVVSQTTSRPSRAASSGSQAPVRASRATSSQPASSKPASTSSGGDAMAQWRKANPKLAEALDKRNAERGTSKTTNPLMKDFIPRMKEREAKAEADKPKPAATAFPAKPSNDGDFGRDSGYKPSKPGPDGSNAGKAVQSMREIPFNPSMNILDPKRKTQERKDRKKGK